MPQKWLPNIVHMWADHTWVRVASGRMCYALARMIRLAFSLNGDRVVAARTHLPTLPSQGAGWSIKSRPLDYATRLVWHTNFKGFQTYPHSSEVELLILFPLIIWSYLSVCYICCGPCDRWDIEKNYIAWSENWDTICQTRLDIKISKDKSSYPRSSFLCVSALTIYFTFLNLDD